MKARDNFFHFMYSFISVCATMTENIPDLIDAPKVELTPLFISAGLGDVIIISVPIVTNVANSILYYLSNPNGDSIQLNINSSITTDCFMERSRSNYIKSYDNVTEYYDGMIKTIMATTIKRMIINFNRENSCDRNHNDFSIGPLGEDDHGNWVLSAYYKASDGDWNELFQVISIEIIESLPTHTENAKLIQGQTFEPRFLFPIIDLQSCEISAPRSSIDRFYDRDRFYLDFCGFRIPNVTKNDEGPWSIIGLGKIVYKGAVYLEIDDL